VIDHAGPIPRCLHDALHPPDAGVWSRISARPPAV
jgi:hypothetical protein